MWLKQSTARDVPLINKFPTQNTVQQFAFALVKHQTHILHLLIKCCPVFSFLKKVTFIGCSVNQICLSTGRERVFVSL